MQARVTPKVKSKVASNHVKSRQITSNDVSVFLTLAWGLSFVISLTPFYFGKTYSYKQFIPTCYFEEGICVNFISQIKLWQMTRCVYNIRVYCLYPWQEATESSVRFGLVFFRRFSSVRWKILTEPSNFLFKKWPETELLQPSFFNCPMDFNVNFFKLFSQIFRMIHNTLIGAFGKFLEKYLDRKNMVWFGKKVFQIRFGEKNPVRSFPDPSWLTVLQQTECHS